jgi:hypothetical protein
MWEAMELLIGHLIDVHELRPTCQGEVLNAVVARERSPSTGLECSLAVPLPPLQLENGGAGMKASDGAAARHGGLGKTPTA